MKSKKSLLLITAVAFASTFAVQMSTSGFRYHPRNTETKQVATDVHDAIDYYHRMRSNQITGTVDIADVEAARNQADALAGLRASVTLNWQELGPDNVGGRTRAILIDKNNPNHLFAGGVGGGLWVTTTAGQSWSKVNDQFDNLAVVSLCQTANGDMYFGTGEGMYQNTGDGTGGLQGKGIWKSTDSGANWTWLSNTWLTTNKNAFVNVNRLAAHKTDNNIVYAATAQGLYVTTDGGNNWAKVTSTPLVSSTATDVEVMDNGNFIAAIGGREYRSTGTTTMVSVTGAGALPTSSRLELAVAPSDNSIAFCAVANSSDLFGGLYRSSDGGTTWTLVVAGSTSATVLPQPFGAQGYYDNACAVFPNNPNKVLVAGLGTYLYTYGGNFVQIANEFESPFNPYYIHADKHVIVFHPTNPDILYIGCDGGVFRSTDGALTFTEMNNGYNTLQCYSVSYANNGYVMCGAQDNGTQLITGNGNTSMTADHVKGGDGGYTEFSTIVPVAFAASQNGDVGRSNGGFFANFFDENTDPSGGTVHPGDGGFAFFVTPFLLWENTHDMTSPDVVQFINAPQVVGAGVGDGNKVRFKADSIAHNYIFQSTASIPFNTVTVTDGVHTATDDGSGHFIGLDIDTTSSTPNHFDYNTGAYDFSWISPTPINATVTLTYGVKYNANATIKIQSNTVHYPFNYTTPSQVNPGDTLNIQDIVQSKFYCALYSGVWMTKRAIDFTVNPQWWKILPPTTSPVRAMAFSRDGDALFVGTDNGQLYRITGLSQAKDSATAWYNSSQHVDSITLIHSFGRVITGIAVNATNPDEIVITLGNYGNTDFVYHSTNALNSATPAFTNITGNLPKAPVYGAILDRYHPDRLFVGTEMGVWSCDNFNPTTWTEQNQNMARVATFMIRQQEASAFGPSSAIFIGTHGRGMWKTTTLTGIDDPGSTSSDELINGIKVYPNPASSLGSVSFHLEKFADVQIDIYSINGNKVKSVSLSNQGLGLHKYNFDVNDLSKGTYFLTLRAGADRKTAKFVVLH